MIASMTPRTGWALLWFAFPFVVTACSAACLLKAADPASGVTPAADPPAVLPPPIAGRAAISPAAPIIPGETVAAFQDGNHEAARGALVKSNCGKTPRTLMNGPTSVIFKASPGDWRATPMRHEQHSEPPPPRTRPAAGFPRSGSSSRPSSWAGATCPWPRNWPAPRPSACCPTIARTAWPRSIMPSRGGCSSPMIP